MMPDILVPISLYVVISSVSCITIRAPIFDLLKYFIASDNSFVKFTLNSSFGGAKNVLCIKPGCPKYHKNLLNSGWNITTSENKSIKLIPSKNLPKINKFIDTKNLEKIYISIILTMPLKSFLDDDLRINLR